MKSARFAEGSRTREMTEVAVRTKKEKMEGPVAEFQEHPVRSCRKEIRGSRDLRLLHKMETHDLPDPCPADQAKLLQVLVETKDDETSSQSRIGREPRDSTSPTAITNQLRGEVEEVSNTEEIIKETIVLMGTDPEGKEVTPTKAGPKEKATDGTTLAVGQVRRVTIEDRKQEWTTEAGMTTDDPTTKWMMLDAKEATTEAGMTIEDTVLDRIWREAC